ncbi:MAG: prolyl oligopeptidase family protein [Sandaracinaceae bacterium]
MRTIASSLLPGAAVPCAVGLTLIACGQPADPGSEHTSGGDSPNVELSLVQRLNQGARSDTTYTLHGVEIADPYRSLEEDGETTRAWIDAQTNRTRERLDAWTDPAAVDRLDALLSIGVVGAPRLAGNRVFYTKRDGDREQPALYVRTGSGEPELLIDPLEYGERAALDWFFPSPTGRYVAYGISSDGDERSTLRVYDVQAHRALDDTIEHAKWSAVAWLHSEDGFYYRRYPFPSEPDYDAEQPDTYHLRVFFHSLGAPPTEDPLVYSPHDRTDFPGVSVSDDDRYVVLNVFKGWSQSEVFLFDRGARARDRVLAPDEQHALVTVVEGQDHLYSAEVIGDSLYVTHNDGAPRYRIDAVPVARASDRSAWHTLVAEGRGTIDGVAVMRDRIVVHAIEDIASVLRTYRPDGRELGTIELPGRGELSGLDVSADRTRIAYGFSSFVHPPAIYAYEARGGSREIDRVQADFDFANVELSQASVPSADGTAINVYYVHPRGMELNGQQRVLLYGYGGFNVSMMPGFQRNALYWVERGGVYAVANLRGGGEFGEDWHRAGNLANKERVFEDFEAVMRWLGGESHISSPAHIAINGGSNGGLLMGAMITRAPDAFGACVSSVGLYDMLRYHEFPPAELWVSEYGSSADETQFGWLRAYSPYHHVRDGVRIPPTLITTADHDSRVFWGHSTKFVARLQEASGEPDPDIYFYMVRQVGHGAGTRRSDTVERYVHMYSFIEHFIGRPG